MELGECQAEEGLDNLIQFCEPVEKFLESTAQVDGEPSSFDDSENGSKEDDSVPDSVHQYLVPLSLIERWGNAMGILLCFSSSFFFKYTIYSISHLFCLYEIDHPSLYISWMVHRHCLHWFKEMLLFHKELLSIRQGHWFPLSNCPGKFLLWCIQYHVPLFAIAKTILIVNMWSCSQKSRGRKLVWRSNGLDTSPQERFSTVLYFTTNEKRDQVYFSERWCLVCIWLGS